MIEHIKREPVDPPATSIPEPDVPQGPSELIWVRDVDFVYGKDDADTLTLAPEDVLTAYDDLFVIEMVGANETVEITRSRVRLWSVRYRQILRQARSFDPADALPQE